MLVSVIVPNYNHHRFLKKRIDSILNQTYQNYEIIILDDHSPDESREIIESYRDHKKVSCILFNDVNSGSTFKQWQKGIEFAKGEWIWIAESDDIAHKEFLNELIKQIKPSIGIVFCRSKLIDEEERSITLYNFKTMPDPLVYSEFGEDFISSGTAFTKKFMLNMNAIPNASSAIFKKELIDKDIFKIAGTTKLFGDWLFWLHLLKKEDISYVTNTYNYFRYHQNTVRKDTLHSSVRLMEYMILVRYVEKNFNLANEALDCLLFIYLFGDIPFTRLTIIEHLKINLFVFKRKPLYLLKSYFRKLKS